MGRPRPAIVVALGLLCACQQHQGFSEQPVTTTSALSTTTTASTTSTTVPLPATPTWRLMAAGDVLLDDTEAAGIDAFAHVSPPLADADLAIVNLETAVASAGTGSAQDKSYVFRTPLSAAGTLARAGVDVVNVANNHSLDFGPAAFVEGLDALRGAGVTPVGGGHDADEASAPVLRTIGGVRVAVLGASRVIADSGWIAGPGHPGVASAYDQRTLVKRVQRAKAEADVVIVVVHWGVELAPCPDATIVGLAKALRAAGATVVLGSHPHVLQPIVQDATGLVAYSLGNFVFHHRTGAAGDTAVLDLGFDGARLVSVTTHPHLLASGPPRPADATASARIRAELNPARCPNVG
ncbi:MAG TPA: CapA family protein [Acidimicrobiales bacterium]|nr:CapA family protein [Acidimicrobiales bacterium]